MSSREDLHTLLKAVLGTSNVYFQPPASLTLAYPCIIYKRDRINTRFSGNKPYSHRTRYQVTVIDRDPDSQIPAKVAALPLCVFDRAYPADNLNHDVFTIFF